MPRYLSLCVAAVIVAVAAPMGTAAAVQLGTGRITNVTSVSGGCVSGPTGSTVQFWDVQPGNTYTITISNVTECANGGTDATLNVRVNSSVSGNTDLVATLVAPGTYTFNYTVPADGACTFPIFYCTTPRMTSSGFQARRNDGGAFQSHLRASTFGPGCTNPQPIGTCEITAVTPRTWGQVKTIYR